MNPIQLYLGMALSQQNGQTLDVIVREMFAKINMLFPFLAYRFPGKCLDMIKTQSG